MGPSASGAAERPRRFYTTVAAAPAPGGFAITLDGRTAKTPAGHDLILPTCALSELVVQEWAAQAERIDFSSMPAARLAFTVIDRTSGAAATLADEIVRYAASDVVCYFADGPEALVARQAADWGPLLGWARDALGVELDRAVGPMPISQPPAALARVRRLVAQMEPFERAGVALATALFGSAVLALALARGRLDAEAAFDLSRLDEAYQEERWGRDAEAEERTVQQREDSRRIERWLRALAP